MQTIVVGSDVLTDTANAVYVYGHWPLLIVTGVLLFRFARPVYTCNA